MPAVSALITNAACPRAPSPGSTTAWTTRTSATPPFVTHAFWPEIIHSSDASSYLAVVNMFATSEPASGSDEQNAPNLTSLSSP